MAKNDLWLAPIDTFKTKAVVGWILIATTEQFEQNIKIPHLYMDEETMPYEVLSEMKTKGHILDYYLYDGKRGIDFFDLCKPVDDTFFLFQDRWYFIPFCYYGAKVIEE